MPIGRKAKDKTPKGVNVDALIEKGGSVATAVADTEDGDLHRITVRFPAEVVHDIDSALKAIPKALRPSRNQWIVEAAYEKLQNQQS